MDAITSVPSSKSDRLYLGGKLHFSIMQAEKNSGSGIVFGHGARTSRVQVFCGSKYLAQSVIKSGLGRLVGERKAKKYEWVGFDSTLRDIFVTPDCPPVVRIIIFDCDRTEDDQHLGEVRLDLKTMIDVQDQVFDLPIVSYDKDRVVAVQGTITIKVSFQQYPLHIITVGDAQTIDCGRMNKLAFSVGWRAPASRRTIPDAVFSTALVMFDHEGKYIDSVDEHRRESIKGALCRFETINPLEGFACDNESIFFSLVDTDRRAANVSFFFLVLLGKTDFCSLQELEDIYFRLQDGRSRKELYRFNMDDIVTPSSSLILARFARDPTSRQKWIMTCRKNMSYDSRNHGYLIPTMRNLLSDMVPDIQGMPSDRVVELRRDESIDLIKFYNEDSPAPVKFVFVTNWTQTEGAVNALVIDCLLINESMSVVDTVSSAKPESVCGGVLRSTSENESGQVIEDAIQLNLDKLDATVTFIAFYACPCPKEDGTIAVAAPNESKHPVPFSCKLCDQESRREICSISSGSLPCEVGTQVPPSCLVSIFFKLKGNFFFQNVTRTAPGENARDNIDHFKQYAAVDKRVLITRTQIDAKMESTVKRYANK